MLKPLKSVRNFAGLTLKRSALELHFLITALARPMHNTKCDLSDFSADLVEARSSFSFGDWGLRCDDAIFRVCHRQRDAGLEPEHLHERRWLQNLLWIGEWCLQQYDF